jgi:hypothetical protein
LLAPAAAQRQVLGWKHGLVNGTFLYNPLPLQGLLQSAKTRVEQVHHRTSSSSETSLLSRGAFSTI